MENSARWHKKIQTRCEGKAKEDINIDVEGSF